MLWNSGLFADAQKLEAVRACVSLEKRHQILMQNAQKNNFSEHLEWIDNHFGCCGGSFQPDPVLESLPLNQLKLKASQVELVPNGCSELKGKIDIQYNQQILQADTAYILRDDKTGQIQQIELLNHVTIREPGKMIVADYARYHPQDASGKAWNAAYRLDLNHKMHAILPGWGRAKALKRASDGIIYLDDASFSTCSPKNVSWQIVAKKLALNPKTERGIAKHTTFRIHDVPTLYLPYMSFPISGKRQSGFLMPTFGYTNISGYDFSAPYYWNMAPNYDATIVPHVYSLRGLMMGGEFRYLSKYSSGMLVGNFLPNDQAFGKFLNSNKANYPQLDNLSKNRWSAIWRDQSHLGDRIGMKIDYQKISDDYYLQDFSSNLAVMTENQLLRQGELNYHNDHWFLRGMLQNYQTLQPINQSYIAHLYARQPQVFAQGNYDHLPGNTAFQLIGQFDQFQWTGGQLAPQGPRMHVNPQLAMPWRKSWGYLTPSVELMSNFYQLSNVNTSQGTMSYSVAIPRYSADTGLYFDRDLQMFSHGWQQTLEPRAYYLYVPYQNQTVVPAFESAYMIFNTDYLYRPNRFSGYDRIGDTNQVSYSLTSRLLYGETGEEKLSLTVGQISYFANRQLNLCYSADEQGNCQDSPLALGYLSPTAPSSPIASRVTYALIRNLSLVANYTYDPALGETNNGDFNLHFQPAPEKVIHLGYSYLTNGNLITGMSAPAHQSSLNQASVAYAWPFNEKWGSLAIYSYNLSNSYAMLLFGGLQYDNCCWAVRLLGGRTFQSLEPQTLQPQYNNNVYFQVLLKGLGSASNSDPAMTIQSYLPGLYNVFKR